MFKSNHKSEDGEQATKGSSRPLAFSQKPRFSIGDLDRERANLRYEFISKSKEPSNLKKRSVRIHKKVFNLDKSIAKYN